MATTSIPTTMRAWTFNHRGRPDQILQLTTNHPVPSPPTGSKLLIRVSHVNVNSAGLDLMHNIPSILRKDAIPEIDFSGRVAQVGPEAPRTFSPGTAVFGTIPPSTSILSGAGTLAEYVLVSAANVALIPSNVRLVEAGCFGGLGQTALKMLEKAGVKKDDWVLIHGGSGGVGMFAIQAAKAVGANVVATCSPSNADMVKEAGADEVHYTTATPLHTQISTSYSGRPFDSILDAVGSQTLYTKSPAYLKPSGTYVNVGAFEDSSQLSTFWRWGRNSLQPVFLGGTPRKFAMFGAAISQEGVQQLAKLAGEEKLKVTIDSVFRMDEALEGYERLLSRKAKGKVVVEIWSGDQEE